MRGRKCLAFARPAPKLAPKAEFPTESEPAQLLLIPSKEGRHEKTGKAEIVVGLDGEANRSDQILHGQWLVKV